MRTCIFNALVVLAFTLASCAEHEVDEPQETTAWDLTSVEGIGQLPDANIGSDKVVVEDITISGDPDFDFQDPPEEGRFPHYIGGKQDCSGCSGIGFALAYAETTGDSAEATMTVHTNDPTSPTFSVPIYLDENLIYV